MRITLCAGSATWSDARRFRCRRRVIVDRVAITVGNKVITDSEIDLRIRLTAFQNGEKAGFQPGRAAAGGAKADRSETGRAGNGCGPLSAAAPDARKICWPNMRRRIISRIRRRWRGAAGYGLTPEDLEDDLVRQTELLTFLNLRFRPAVQVTDEDVRKYFNEKVCRAGEGAQASAE